MKTNKLNVAAALRAAAARPSLESEGTVVTDNAAPETGEATAETDLEAVKATTVEVGERSDLEAAETEVKGADAHHDGTETTVEDSAGGETASQESLIGAAAIVGGGVLLMGLLGAGAGGLSRRAEEMRKEVAAIELDIQNKRGALSELCNKAIADAKKKGLIEIEGTKPEDMSITIRKDETAENRLIEAEIEQTSSVLKGAFGGLVVGGTAAAGAAIAPIIGAVAFAVAITGVKGKILKACHDIDVQEKRLTNARKELSLIETQLTDSLTKVKVSQESEGSEDAQAAGEAAAQAAANVALGAQAAAEAAAAAVIAADAEVIGEPVEEAAAVVEVEAESEETEAEIEADVAHVEEYEKEAVALEALIEAARDARDAGGFSRGEARLFQIGFESIGTRLTGQPFLAEDGGSAVPSLESFGGTMSRRDATTISLENAESWLAKIIRVIKETWTKVWGAVKKFLSQVFDLVERYKARAEKVKKAALDGRAQKADAAVKFGSAAKIAIGGKVDVSGADKLIQLASVGEKLAELTPAAQVSLNEILYAVGHDVSKAGAEVGSYYDSQATAIKNVFTSGGAFSDMGDVRVADGLPGNMKFSVKVNGDDVGAVVADAGEAGEIGEVRALSGQETAQLMDKVIKTLDEVAKAKSALAKVKDDIVTSINADGGNAAQKADGAVVRMVGRLIMTSTRSVSKILGYCVKTSGGYIDYGVASVKAAGAGQAARQQIATA